MFLLFPILSDAFGQKNNIWHAMFHDFSNHPLQVVAKCPASINRPTVVPISHTFLLVKCPDKIRRISSVSIIYIWQWQIPDWNGGYGGVNICLQLFSWLQIHLNMKIHEGLACVSMGTWPINREKTLPISRLQWWFHIISTIFYLYPCSCHFNHFPINHGFLGPTSVKPQWFPRWWVSAAYGSLVASGSACPSPGPCCGLRRRTPSADGW